MDEKRMRREKTTPPYGHTSEVDSELINKETGMHKKKTTPPCGHPSRGGDLTRVPNVNSEYNNQYSYCGQSSPAEGCQQQRVEYTEPFTYIRDTPIFRHFTSNLPSNHSLAQRARELRKAGNLAEILFWKKVHKGKFHKIDFDRQKVIGSYIVDFYVKCLSLIVEIDGLSHVGKEKYDTQRQEYLESLGLTVYRIKDSRVLNDIENVMRELEVFVSERYGRLPCNVDK